MTRAKSQNARLFWIAVAALGCGAVYMQLARANGWLMVIKGALPIRKPLIDLNRAALAPFRFERSLTLDVDTLGELGTKEYINWALDDATAVDKWAARSMLLVTYFTGTHDQLPHIPEECYFQGDFSLLAEADISLSLPNLGRTVEVRRLVFEPPGMAVAAGATYLKYVYYLIAVNGDLYVNRQRVRLRLADSNETHMYHSKVEIAYDVPPDTAAADVDRAILPLLDRVLTELYASHWPPKEWARGGQKRDG